MCHPPRAARPTDIAHTARGSSPIPDTEHHIPNVIPASAIDNTADDPLTHGIIKTNRNKRARSRRPLDQTLPYPLAQKVRIHAMRQRQPRYRRPRAKAC
jgi:hypothetical protein